jgi:hypothetical protein
MVWGFASRASILSELSARSLQIGRARVEGSWMPSPADDTLSYSELKDSLGEFAITGTKRIHLDPVWTAANLVTVHWRLGDVTIVKVCHRVIAAITEAIFDQITAAGLAPFLNADSSRRSGGCFNPRTVRSIGSTSGGNMSVHAWGAALDIDVAANCLGCVPKMKCEIVQIFRANGFAWGGNFLTPDGMHFEWVGEPRDQVATRPGDYCPAPAPAPPPTSTTTTSTSVPASSG